MYNCGTSSIPSPICPFTHMSLHPCVPPPMYPFPHVSLHSHVPSAMLSCRRFAKAYMGCAPPPNPAPLMVGSLKVEEGGSLARAGSVLDCAARRVLPGHLLRRCRVLSCLQRAPREYVLRVAVTGELEHSTSCRAWTVGMGICCRVYRPFYPVRQIIRRMFA